MADGTRNTPLPITVPMTIEMALHKPRTRCRLGPGARRVAATPVSAAVRSSDGMRVGALADDQARTIADRKGSNRSYNDVPGIRHVAAK